MKEILVRTLSGVLYISIIIIALFTSREWFMGLFFLLAVITLSEYLKLVHLNSYLSYFLLAVAFYFLSYRVFDTNAVFLLLILSGFVNLFLLKDVLWTSKIPMFGRKKYVTVILYIISGFVFLTLIPVMDVDGAFKPEMIVAVFIIVWSNDTFAYLIGKNLGKHKLLERISPKKTIEGFVGGMLGALLAGFVIFKTLERYNLTDAEKHPLWVWIVMAIIVAIFGTIGDLIQSKFKRQAGVKDSGIIMPGHGGLYDRLDSIVYASPFIYAFLLMLIMFHKEGFKIIFIALVVVIGLSLLANVFVEDQAIRGGIIISLTLLLLLVLQFFRNPKRNFSVHPKRVLSPVDGKVVVIEEVFEKEYFNAKRIQVSIFMSPINVHVTRYPVGGKIVYSKYHPGKYLVAWHPKSSEENERTTVVVKNEVFGDVLHRQIAGAMAKRIVNYAKINEEVGQTSDSGFIKFGSRVDVFLPLGTKINVALNQKVKGGNLYNC